MPDNAALACRLCGALSEPVFEATLLAHHRVQYQYCASCDYLQTERPHWLEEAYARPITLQDTGVLQRNFHLSRATALTLFEAGLCDGPYLDYAGGYGLMTRLMRDFGFDYYWNDPHTENLFAAGFERPLQGRYQAITAFEVFEHLVDPIDTIGSLLEHTDTVVCSTELRPTKIPDCDWAYYGFAHGQHIGFFSSASLAWVADRLQVRLVSDGAFLHVLTRDPDLEIPKLRGLRAKRRLRALRRRLPSLTIADSERATTRA